MAILVLSDFQVGVGVDVEAVEREWWVVPAFFSAKHTHFWSQSKGALVLGKETAYKRVKGRVQNPSYPSSH